MRRKPIAIELIHRRVPSIAIGLTIFIYCGIVWSDPIEDGDLKSKAQTHFSRGEAFFQSGKYQEAAQAFLLAYNTLPHYAVLVNVGLAYERAGDYPKTVEYFQRYLEALSKDGKINPQIEELFQQTLAKVSKLDVSAECPSKPCHIYVDNMDRGLSPVHVVVFPGAHELLAKGDDGSSVVQKLNIGAGETGRYKLAGIPVPTMPRAGVEKSDKTRMGIPFWATAGSALAVGCASGILWGLTFSTKKDFDRENNNEEQRQLQTKGEALQIGASVTAGVAGAAAVAAAVLAAVRVVSPKKHKKEAASVTTSIDGMGIRVQF